MKEVIEIGNIEEASKEVEQTIRNIGVSGLSYTEATRLGVFERIATLLTAMHATACAAFKIYGDIQNIVSVVRADRNAMKYEMERYIKSYERFCDFFAGHYTKSYREVNTTIDDIYHLVMDWLQVPEKWDIGDKQRVVKDIDVSLSVQLNGSSEDIKLVSKTLNNSYEQLKEAWGVFRLDRARNISTCVVNAPTKKEANSAAENLSKENPDDMYAVCQMCDVVETKTVVMPYRAYSGGKSLGTLRKEVKQCRV